MDKINTTQEEKKNNLKKEAKQELQEVFNDSSLPHKLKFKLKSKAESLVKNTSEQRLAKEVEDYKEAVKVLDRIWIKLNLNNGKILDSKDISNWTMVLDYMVKNSSGTKLLQELTVIPPGGIFNTEDALDKVIETKKELFELSEKSKKIISESDVLRKSKKEKLLKNLENHIYSYQKNQKNILVAIEELRKFYKKFNKTSEDTQEREKVFQNFSGIQAPGESLLESNLDLKFLKDSDFSTEFFRENMSHKERIVFLEKGLPSLVKKELTHQLSSFVFTDNQKMEHTLRFNRLSTSEQIEFLNTLGKENNEIEIEIEKNIQKGSRYEEEKKPRKALKIYQKILTFSNSKKARSRVIAIQKDLGEVISDTEISEEQETTSYAEEQALTNNVLAAVRCSDEAQTLLWQLQAIRQVVLKTKQEGHGINDINRATIAQKEEIEQNNHLPLRIHRNPKKAEANNSESETNFQASSGKTLEIDMHTNLTKISSEQMKKIAHGIRDGEIDETHIAFTDSGSSDTKYTTKKALDNATSKFGNIVTEMTNTQCENFDIEVDSPSYKRVIDSVLRQTQISLGTGIKLEQAA